jgi:3-hydroxyisobutyrate dehydrogenase
MNTASIKKSRVALFGLGLMGGGMAHRLLGAVFPLTIYARNREKAAPFIEAGAQFAGTPKEAAAQADVIIGMVSDDTASRSLWHGENGALAGAARGTICIECSTLTVGWIRELSAAAAAKGCELLDAPVTGSKAQAASGELNFLVGGALETLEKIRPVLSAMGKSIVPLGPIGSGALLKLVNNFVCGVQVAALAEAIALIERGGLDRTTALAVLTNGAPGSPLVKAVCARMVTPDYTPNFLLRLMAKDLTYAIQEGGKLSVELKTAAAALADFQNAIAAGHGEKDIAAVAEPLLKKARGVLPQT